MATKTEVVLVDDLTGDPADTTVTFSLDNNDYEIDLSNDNAAELRETLARYVNAARRAPGARRRAVTGSASYSGYDPAAVRAWAIRPGDRGQRARAHQGRRRRAVPRRRQLNSSHLRGVLVGMG